GAVFTMAANCSPPSKRTAPPNLSTPLPTSRQRKRWTQPSSLCASWSIPLFIHSRKKNPSEHLVSMSDNTSISSEQAVLTGGAALTGSHVDGTSETVTVRLLKIREFPDYLRLTDQEEQLAAFLCGKDEAWAQTLTVDS